MEEDILCEILHEMKGFRNDLGETNKRLDDLTSSMVVLQQGFSDMRFELVEIKKLLSDKVIWNNNSVSIDAESGPIIQGVINKRGKL